MSAVCHWLASAFSCLQLAADCRIADCRIQLVGRIKFPSVVAAFSRENGGIT